MLVFANALSTGERAFRFFRSSLLLLLSVACLLGGCMRKEPRADIVIVNGAEPESLDPAIMTGQPDIRVVMSLFEGLTRYDPVTGDGVAGLADHWEISPDRLTYTFHLRSNAVWSTGERIAARDVIYSWLRALNPMTAADYAGQLFFVENAEEYNSGKVKDPSSVGVRALDDLTVRVRLKSPCPFFLDLCAFPTLAVVPRNWIEKYGDRWIMTPPVPVSGPYTLEAWRIHDKIRIRKNPRYWDAANTHSEIIDLLPVDSATIALNLYETRQADIIWDKNVIPLELMDLLRNRPDCHTFPFLGNYFFRFNVTRPPLNDARVRRALALCVDRKRIVSKLCKAGETAADRMTPDGTANSEPAQGLGFDPVQGRRLLAEAGFPNGQGFRTLDYLFNNSKQNEQMAIEMQEMWQRELGVRIQLRQVEWKVYLVAQSALDYDLSRSSWVADYNDPNTFLDMWTSNNGNNRTGWKNARYDELMAEGNRQTDLKKRAKLLAEAETLLVRDEVPVVPIYFWVGINFFRTNEIQGIFQNVVDEHPVAAISRKKPPQP